MSLLDVLAKLIYRHGRYKDHMGNRFDSIEDMCLEYRIPCDVYDARKDAGWSLEKILRTPVAGDPLDDTACLGCKKCHLGIEMAASLKATT